MSESKNEHGSGMWILAAFIIEYLFRKYRIDSDLETVGKWAFGEEFMETDICESPARWNALHGDLFVIAEDEEFQDYMDKIIKAYAEHHHEVQGNADQPGAGA